MSILRELLSEAVRLQASDLHLKVGQPPVFRIFAKLVPQPRPALTLEAMREILAELVPPPLREALEHRHEIDFSISLEGIGRFRINVFYSRGEPTIAARHVKDRIPSFEELHLPAVVRALAESQRGIVIASGTTGCGKSTTLAAMIQHINRSAARRIITVEDPIEYIFQDDKSVVSQREIAQDTVSFHTALKYILRQDPDVILIGEMRDAESFRAALAAADTGHLVFTTLHTDTAAQAISRILNFFPHAERDQIRMSLAGNLRAVICQRLVPALAGGVVPAVEILINTPIVRKLIEENQLEKLPAAIETGGEDGMQTFNQSLYQLIRSGMISEEEGMRFASNPEQLRMNLRGVFLDEARRILAT